MSFGFSVGDFVTVGLLIRQIFSSLRIESVKEYNELKLELHGLQRALYGIEHLRHGPGQEATVNGIKVAALMCQYPLKEFATKIEKYNSLGHGYSGLKRDFQLLRSWRKKLQWGFCMQDEVAKLRAYLAAHVGSLTMRLVSEGL